jgi:hypothetical protein
MSIRKIKKITTIASGFDLLMRDFFCLGDCGAYHSSLCPFVSGSYSKNQFPSLVMTRLKNVVQS